MSSETSSLLGSSSTANSSDSPTVQTCRSVTNPLRSSYEDLKETVELQLQETLRSATSSKRKGSVPSNNYRAILVLVIGCVLSVLFVSSLHLHGMSPTNPPPSPNGNGFGPFSLLHPVYDLGLPAFDRPEATQPPRQLFVNRQTDLSMPDFTATPTNAWYQNLLLLDGEPINVHRAYSMPYLLDMEGLIPGIRIHSNHILASAKVLQLSFNEEFGISVGAAPDLAAETLVPENLTHRYHVLETTELGLTLQWNVTNMTSTIVKGMAYVTMEYEGLAGMLPTIASSIAFGDAPIVDQTSTMKCTGSKILAQSELQLHFAESNFTWMVFFSEPVWLTCYSSEDTKQAMIQVVSTLNEDNSNNTKPLIVRAALLDSCSNGKNSAGCKVGLGGAPPEESNIKEYADLLRRYARFYPGRNSSVSLEVKDESTQAAITFDWDVQKMSNDTQLYHPLRSSNSIEEEATLITFALPHHLDLLDPDTKPDGKSYCRSSLYGPTCLVEGATWTLKENLPRIGLQAPRAPRAQFVPALAEAVMEDINYTLPEFFERGAGDTYFSGKMISKLSRILLITEELEDICGGKRHDVDMTEYRPICSNVTLPSRRQQREALDRLRRYVQVWIDGTGETPFVYDATWGGVVSCGCWFDGTTCTNQYPNCPAFEDQGLNFGNGFYNDQHFHYGYHIHGAAVVSHFDPAWGRKHFEQVLFLVRNIANPSKDDKTFPLYRHKDWYQGSSWASGVPLPPYLNGKNQESSSEAIAAYESVALFGQVMSQVWESSHNEDKAAIARDVEIVGQVLAATELTAANKYWHIRKKDQSKSLLPEIYEGNVVGILWSTMTQFGTWFGTSPYLPYGIQLLPLTPISELRDELDWVNEMYYPFSKACSEDHQCSESGWAVLQLATLATVGYAHEAAARMKELPDEGYSNAGGNGHSKSNTLWYIATRPVVENPVKMDASDYRGHEELRPEPVFELTNCHAPSTCTDEVLDTQAGEYTCRERINFLIHTKQHSQWEACSVVAEVEFVEECGPCSPASNTAQSPANTTDVHHGEDDELHCPPCTESECNSDLNRCPIFERTFVCTGGANSGGCSGYPWSATEGQCSSCCEMTACQKLRDEESKKITRDGNGLEQRKCPPCERSVCYGKVNQCPIHTAPYICLHGKSEGGCSSTPWNLGEGGQCDACCEIVIDC